MQSKSARTKRLASLLLHRQLLSILDDQVHVLIHSKDDSLDADVVLFVKPDLDPFFLFSPIQQALMQPNTTKMVSKRPHVCRKPRPGQVVEYEEQNERKRVGLQFRAISSFKAGRVRPIAYLLQKIKQHVLLEEQREQKKRRLVKEA